MKKNWYSVRERAWLRGWKLTDEGEEYDEYKDLRDSRIFATAYTEGFLAGRKEAFDTVGRRRRAWERCKRAAGI